MVRNDSQTTSRVDYHLERQQRSYENLDDVPSRVVPDTSELRHQAKRHVRCEDERIWAFYRDPETELTQMESRDRAQRTDYPDRYQIVQSSVSRVVSRLDDKMLTEPIHLLNVREPSGPNHELGLLPPALVDKLGPRYGADVLDELRESLAKFLVDREALKMFTVSSEPTPEWAEQRFPDLDPDVGRNAALTNADIPEEEVHDSAEARKEAVVR